MPEDIYLITQESAGWCITAGDQPRGTFRTKEEAFDAAADAARRSRRLGRFASIKLRHGASANLVPQS